MFEKTLHDLVTGIRSHRRDTALYISQNMAEIKQELKSSDFLVKSNALQKLTFLQMMGYTMSWAAFCSVEVMSNPRFALKRIGYLAACQGLDQPDKSPVVLLTTNLLKKELRGATVGGTGENAYHAGLAINCLSNIVTTDLGRELFPELLHLLNHPSPYVRKKALLCLYKVFLKYPQGLRLSFDKIKQCLDDTHSSVVSCAVNVITELSNVNPKNYLPLAPAFFKLLTSSANNWMLIKVVKLLGALVPEEPRLARKLLDPLANIVRSTHAKSLLYEAVYAITLCLQYGIKKTDASTHHQQQQQHTSSSNNIPQIVDLSVETLRTFIQDSDQNLKYLGLVAFGSLLQSQPKVLHMHSECKGMILKCLSDDDVTIRTRALGLLKYMTTKKNLVELITQLLGHVEAASGEYQCDLVQEIVRMCSSNKYELVMDFVWYFNVLVTLAGVRGIELSQGDGIAKQWMDVAWRVLPVRSYAVKKSEHVLVSRSLGVVPTYESGKKYCLPQVLPAAAWIVGEYSHLIPEALENTKRNDDGQKMYNDPIKGPYHALVQAMTSPTDAAGIKPILCSTQAVFVQNAMKVFAAACHRNLQTQINGNRSLDYHKECTDEEILACVVTLLKNLPVFMTSSDVEVRERSFTSYQLLLSVGLPSTICTNTNAASIATICRNASPTLTHLLIPEPMKPISAKAQRRILAEGPPSPISVQEWEADINWDAFWFIQEETPWFGRDGTIKGSVESISFTRQLTNAPTTYEEEKCMLEQTSIERDQVGSPFQGGMETFSLGSSTAKQLLPMHTTSSSNRREGDPFYLNSSNVPASGPVVASTANGPDRSYHLSTGMKDITDTAGASRFGSIKLDSEGESDEENSERRLKKKKKKAKKKSSQTNILPSVDLSLNEDFVGSEDDEEDNGIHRPKRGITTQPSRAKEVENLAMVDLTTPLGDEDIMPRNEHYVAPERPRLQPESVHNKSKKSKKDKKKKTSRKNKPVESMTGDLLGFESLKFGSISEKAVPHDTVSADMSRSNMIPLKPDIGLAQNRIDSAFDDLLGLEMSMEPLSILAVNEPKIPDVDKKAKAKKASKKVKKEKKSSRKIIETSL